MRPAMRLAITQRSALRRLCSAAKERLLGEAAPDRVPITRARRRPVARRRLDHGRSDARRGRADAGRIPAADAGRTKTPRPRSSRRPARARACRTRPIRRSRATWPRFSRAPRPSLRPTHRGRRRRRAAGAMIRPDLVLFNGGFFTPPVARERDRAGAGGMVRRARRGCSRQGTSRRRSRSAPRPMPGCVPASAAPGSLVKAGSGRAYYIGLRAPRERGRDRGGLRARARHGGRDGTDHRSSVHGRDEPCRSRSRSTARRPVRIAPATSSSLAPGDDAHEHAPLVTVFRYGRKSRQVELPVRLSVAFTEVGTLELWCRVEVDRAPLAAAVSGAERRGRSTDGAEEAASRRVKSSEVVIAERRDRRRASGLDPVAVRGRPAARSRPRTSSRRSSSGSATARARGRSA